MARKCSLTGKRPGSGNHVSHANNRVKRRWMPNIQDKTIFVPELGRSVRIRMSVRAMRTLDKMGLMAFLKKNNLRLEDVAK